MKDPQLNPTDTKFAKIFNKFSDIFHKLGLWLLIACVIGISIGINVTRQYYKLKTSESIAVGGFVFDQKVYSISPK